jgi:uncharacterized protein
MEETKENQAEQNASIEKPAREITNDDKNMAMLCHLLAIFTSFIGPLVIWLIKKDESPFVNEQGKEALNFQITVIIAMCVSGLLTFVCIGALLIPVVGVVDLVFCIMATVKTSRGEAYRYPVSLRLLK